jgi:hypothetical protein
VEDAQNAGDYSLLTVADAAAAPPSVPEPQKNSKKKAGTKRKIVEVNDEDGEDDAGDAVEQPPVQQLSQTTANAPINPYYDDIDGDIESYILSPEEQVKRAAIWEKSFRTFVDERASKRAAKLAEEAARQGILPEELMNAVNEAGVKGANTNVIPNINEYNASHNLYLTKTGKWRKKSVRRDNPVSSVSQAVLGASGMGGSVAVPKSKKINYEVLKVRALLRSY